MLRGARAALAVLTRFPAGPLASGDFARAPGWFGLLGLGLGALQGGVFLIGLPLWGSPIAAFLALAVGVWAGGALHEDGLADTADALGQPRPAERALEILRDSRIGSYGAIALVLGLGLKGAALAELGGLAPVALVVAGGLSRLAMALALRCGPYLRSDGAASGMTGGWGRASGAAALAACFIALSLSASWLGLATIAGLAGLLLFAGAIWVHARRRLGGVTGDILGAIQFTAELGFLLGVLAWL